MTACRKCSAPLPRDALDGLCPACLVTLALELPTTPNGEVGAIGSSSSLGKIRYFGDYELLEEIAHGGMGVVYKARQLSLNRIVAVKMLLAGHFASREFVQRFHEEAAAAANLQHPNIVAIHEVGEQDGQQYFSMDYVEGENLADLIRARPVSANKAASYVRAIAEAIHYAHERGTLHRDLKPSNVLIDAFDQPRITDFGLAKRLHEESSLTVTGQALGSPGYMAPEQVTGKRDHVGVAADIYSLGAILYHLLTGRAPFWAETLEGTFALLLHNEPVSPRALNPGIPRDLETICLKCLEKEPQRRYPSAEALAKDLERWLDGQPIQARPVSQWERGLKWVKRRPVIAGLVLSLLAVFLLGLLGVLWQWQRAEQLAAKETEQRHRAEAQRKRAEADEKKAETEAARSAQVAQFMKDMLRSLRPGIALGRDTTLLREILDETALRLDTQLTNQPTVEADLRATLGKVYGDLGDYAKASAMLERSLLLRRQVHGHDHLETAQSLYDLGYLHLQRGQQAEAAEAFRTALEIRRKLQGDEHPDTATSLAGFAEALRVAGSRINRTEPEPLIRQALAIRRKVLGNDHPDVADSLNSLGSYLNSQDRHHEAEPVFREAVAIRRKVFKNPHPAVANALQGLGTVLLSQEKIGQAVELFREAEAMCRKLYGHEHPDLADALHAIAKAFREQGKLSEAEVLFREALAMRRKFFGNDDPRIAGNLNFVGFTLLEQDQPAAAETVFREALAIQIKLSPTHRAAANALDYVGEALEGQNRLSEAEIFNRDALAIRKSLTANKAYYLIKSLENLTRVLRKQGRNAEIKSLWDESLENLRTLISAEDLEMSHSLVGPLQSLLRAGQFGEAEAILGEYLKIQKQKAPSDWHTFNIQSMLGGALLGQKKYAEAELLLLSACEGMNQRADTIPKSGKPHLKQTLRRLVQFYEETNRPEQAAEWKQKLAEFDNPQSRAGNPAGP